MLLPESVQHSQHRLEDIIRNLRQIKEKEPESPIRLTYRGRLALRLGSTIIAGIVTGAAISAGSGDSNNAPSEDICIMTAVTGPRGETGAIEHAATLAGIDLGDIINLNTSAETASKQVNNSSEVNPSFQVCFTDNEVTDINFDKEIRKNGIIVE